MKKMLTNRRDIELLVDSFYDKVKVDPLIGYIFNDVMKVKWEKHLPRIYDFWENTLLYTGVYNGNPLDVHRRLNKVVPLKAEHFKRWTDLFCTTVDELYDGEKAMLAKQRALSISNIIQLKM
ncbi:MAG: group III truncated hemoglobin [Chitinophagaceae bacterium]|nr:MAG: group III truncated hemoglobin [Chitinophagaceae bacterium]